MSKRFIGKKFPLVLAIVLINQAMASEEVVKGETVTIWGTEVKSSLVSLGEDTIELKQADHLSDLLRDQPGVDVGGAHSLNQRINIRGLQDTDLEITIDGARQNSLMYHHMGNLLVNADILKSVDIQVGANSVLNSGLGGGVAFETKDASDLLTGDDKAGMRVHTTYASNAYWMKSLTAYAKEDNADILAYFTKIDRDNPEDGKGNETIGNDGEITNMLLKFGLDMNEHNVLSLVMINMKTKVIMRQDLTWAY